MWYNCTNQIGNKIDQKEYNLIGGVLLGMILQ